MASDPVPAVLESKLQQGDSQVKKDNKRWRTIIYLTVTVCCILFCLVVRTAVAS